ncbi:MAG: DNA repair protein RadA [Ruminococcus sp.]|jgi:DNA repair protein RadA/Sms|nr:DNA repair protein RadA [Ruminococcus sp.]
MQKSLYICTECAYETPKWYGKCPSCGAWNSFEESEIAPKAAKSSKSGSIITKGAGFSGSGKSAETFSLAHVDINTVDVRYDTGTTELNRVLGGGLVKGSIVLLGGEPGIGKSTLLLQICENFGTKHSVLYISGEESLRQIKLRANRLRVTTPNLQLLCANDAETIIDTIAEKRPDIVIIDSIQTMRLETVNSSAGSITQVRECTNLFMQAAKTFEIPVILVGHVNKDGGIAGPKVMEHIVDTVLLFEGEKHYSYRLLRTVKNRFGSTNEIGVFDMTQGGLKEIPNPSQMLLEGRQSGVSGSCVACITEGSRPVLAEVQALVNKAASAYPQRVSTGLPWGRTAILLAVLEKRAKMYMSRLDVFINIVGGFRLDEPAGDLPVAIALYSAVFDAPVDEYTASFGEVGLGGEIRAVPNMAGRISEAQRMGFKKILVPVGALKSVSGEKLTIEVAEVRNVSQAFELIQKN